MSALRICPHCGTANDQQATYCGACATQIVNRSTALVRVPKKKSLLPVLSSRDKARLGGVALGVAAMAVQVGMKVLEHMAESSNKKGKLTQPTTQTGLATRQPTTGEPSLVIRRRWVMNDGIGPTRWGEEEIEVHQPNDGNSYKISFK